MIVPARVDRYRWLGRVTVNRNGYGTTESLLGGPNPRRRASERRGTRRAPAGAGRVIPFLAVAPAAAAGATATAVGVVGALLAYRTERRGAYLVAKAVASAGFVATALVVGALDGTWTRVAFAAILLSAVGDVALAARGRRAFLVGLAAFAAAHLTYAAAFALAGPGVVPWAWAGAGAALLVGGAWLALRRRVPAGLRVAVAGYAVILVAMMATGVAVGVTLGSTGLALGALLVAGSDVAVGRERFGTRGFANKLAGLPAYYLGQVLIALALGG